MCKAPVKSPPPTNQDPVFTVWMPFLSSNRVRVLKENAHFSSAYTDLRSGSRCRGTVEVYIYYLPPHCGKCYWQNSWEGNNACWLFHFNFTASLTLPSLQSHQIWPMDTRQQLLRTWKSAVVRMCRESGLQQTSIRPAEPSSILHVHSGCSSDQTCKQIITNTF